MAPFESPAEYNDFLRQQRWRWACRIPKLREERKAWVRAMPSTVRQVAGHLVLPLFLEVPEEIAYEDLRAAKDFRHCFRVGGRIPASGVFGGNRPKRTIPPQKDRNIFTNQPSKDCPASRKPPMVPGDADNIRASFLKEAKGGWLDGPYKRGELKGPYWDGGSKSWQVKDYDRFYPGLRFLVKQDVAHGADPERPVDDFTSNGLNGTTTVEEAVRLSTLDDFAALAKCMRSFFPESEWGPLRLWKIDMAKAYKQVPAHPDDRHNMVIGVLAPGG